MACTTCDSGGGGCGAGCSCDSPLPPRIHLNAETRPPVCVKCNSQVGAVAVGAQPESMCTACLHLSLLAKFKTAVNNNGLVLPSDKVLVAFSGGPASRVALELLKEILSKAESDAIGAKHRGLKVFGLGAVFVDEQVVLPAVVSSAPAVVDEISKIFLDGGQETIPLHVVQLECIFDSQQRDQLKISSNAENPESVRKQEMKDNAGQKVLELFQSVKDSTGKEDLLEYLRMQAIQQVAMEHGYTKVVLGLCATRIAARIIAATTKGQGFSLSAGIQYLDARWPIPVVLPLRDCVARDLAMFCYLSKFTTVFIKGLTTLTGARSTLNNLAHSFVNLLQEDNPAREYTIVRTAAKLKSFSFNEVAEPRNRRRRNPQGSTKDSAHLQQAMDMDILCPICHAPLDKTDILNVGRSSSRFTEETVLEMSQQALDFKRTCCPSCRFQIFPEEGQEASEKYKLLPKIMKDRSAGNVAHLQSWMRSQVESYLLQEDDDN